MRRILDLPFMVILIGIGALAMYVPAIHGFATRNYPVSRAFLYSGTLFLLLAAVLGIATAANRPSQPARGQLLTLLGTFTVLPVMLAVPMAESVPAVSLYDAWWEMVSSLTTTGATLFYPESLPPTVHLWRALVGWMGGFFVLVTAVAILAPMNLGGFEVLTGATAGQGAVSGGQVARGATASERLVRYTLTLLPVYGGSTLVLWIGLILAGDTALVAACHAMSTLSTSGISPVGGMGGTGSGVAGEFVIFPFLVFGLSRRFYPSGRTMRNASSLIDDPELRMALLLLTVVPALLFLRHWVGAFEVDEVADTVAALRALWGGVFTVLSFMTTTGFESGDWAEARTWSGLATPGLILVGLSVIGGGVATTAGGVKLLRVYALYRHGEREIERLVHPSSIGGAGVQARKLRRQGAQMAWIFFMLFALSIAITMLALALTGLDFQASTTFAVAALSTTGPLATVAGEFALRWAELDAAARAVAAAAMVLGRLETLAIIALLNPDFWRG
ncbi:TrkH family potassium uptake protein [Defluviimonas sp. WL0024]|uniref:TrkH family potassium uptake protein n=2 Tax=Albidovulum TaxID=205889 RepID=A0ABT3J0C2_9RHOB|nr:MULTISPECIES: potassium transporter TrkG [Defluviimonas]MCU9846873.1 TrkH family potassium uptake protein [Defluviimonas sp. WL0024]MCW3781132.1 TrkH family potassium uptake protein [Defluviimonas salinarum]